jgi:CheY-like chemotaxis protein
MPSAEPRHGVASTVTDSRPSRPSLFEELQDEFLTSGVTCEGHPLQLSIYSRSAESPETPSFPLQESEVFRSKEVISESIIEPLAAPNDIPVPTAKLRGRILVVEDAPDIQGLVRLFLTSAGLEVTLAANGRNALETALECAQAGRPFDVILMDMQMPVLDGYRATEGLRASGYSGIIVALTAHALPGERERCLAAGCDDFLVKPINRTTLLGAMKRHLQPHVPL